MPSNKKKKQTKKREGIRKKKKLFRLKCRINSIYDTLVSKREKKNEIMRNERGQLRKK
jgi:hypothetical protein